MQTNGTQKVALMNSKHTQKTCANKQIEPGLVTFNNIRPGNETDLFFLPRSPHGASRMLDLQPRGRRSTLTLVHCKQP